jgi:xanthine dehydrogenase accessory factor
VTLADRLLEVARSDERAVAFTVVEGERAGEKLLVLLDRDEVDGSGPDGLAERAPEIRRNGIVEHEGLQVYAEVYGPPPRLVVIGAVDTGEALCAAARAIGWRTICIDARGKFATADRIPSADEIVVAWPDDALERIRPDRDTAIVVLTHEERFDLPALQAALTSDAFYVGALGSRKAQTRRRERLLEAGVPEEALERLHGPCGLDVGAVTPAETAVSILAEALAVLAGRPGGPLQAASGRIHAETR